MRPTALTLAVATSALLLTACSSASSSIVSTVSTTTPSPAASRTDSPTAGTSPTGTSSAVATSLDPCKLVTSSEASALSGRTYPAGKASTASSGLKSCVYSISGRSLTVEVVQATDAATAQAAWSQAQAAAQVAIKTQLPPGLQVNLTTGSVPGLGDRAATLQGSESFAGHSLGVSGIYVLKGATFFAFQDISIGGGTAASSADMQAQARTTLGRVS